MATLSMSLHAVNHRLTNIPVKQLPPLASCLAASLSNCGELLASPQNHKAGKSDSDTGAQVHKLMARLTSLLQDRTPEGRFTAVVLVKAVVEAGQWEVLRACEPFVRGLMAILTKPDPVATKKMCIITLTRIFHLTYQYPTLVREITTPSLPGFVTSALNLVSVKPSSAPIRTLKPNTPTSLLETVLQAFAELIARHPTIFRPFTAQLHSLLQTIISATSPTFPESVVDLAERLFVLLHVCAPKNTAGEEWKKACQLTIHAIHETTQYVFRAVVEQWESVDPTLRHAGKPQDSHEVTAFEPDALGLAPWQGLESGVDRLVVLLRLLSRFLTTPTASAVTLPIGSILDLTSRLTSLTVPADARDVQANPQIGRAERESLFAELPRIHVSCVEVLSDLVGVLETGSLSVAQTILEQTLWVFRAEKSLREVRSSIYDLTRGLLAHMGPSMTKQGVSSLTVLVKACCADIQPPVNDQPAASKGSSSKSNPSTANADSFLNPGLKQGRSTDTSSLFPGLKSAACDLLSALLTHIPIEYLSPALRAEMDRTIILTSDKHAMMASVMNPVPATQGRGVPASIIPFLARSHPAEMEVEALIRPRMPVLMNATNLASYQAMDEDDEDDEETSASASAAQAAPATNTFLQSTATPILHSNLMDTDPAPKQTPSASKRTHVDEPTQVSTPAKKTEEPVPSKKPRVDDNATTTGSQPALDKVSPATFTDTAAISVPPPSTVTASVAPAPVSSVSTRSTAAPVAAVAATAEDESDDELPVLDIEPDTDDEEDEDVNMAD